jgi:hypothetical protein
VESPGTAPGSDPIITSAFMSIVPKDNSDIGDGWRDFNGPDVGNCALVCLAGRKKPPRERLCLGLQIFQRRA